MKATEQDRLRLQNAIDDLAAQLKAMGAIKIILFGSLARGEVSLFSDIDMLVLFAQKQPARELTRRVYQQIQTNEAVDILAYNSESFQQLRERPFFRKILQEGKVLYEKSQKRS